MKWLLVTVALYMQPGEEPRVGGVMIKDTTQAECEAGEYFRAYQDVRTGKYVTEIASCIQQSEA